MNSHPKTILITGTTSGLGAELLRRYDRDGHNVVSVNRRSDSKLEAEFPRARFFVTDISRSQDVEALFQKLQSQSSLPDTLILNAGINEMDYQGNLDLSVFRKVVETNLYGTLTFIETLQKMGLGNRTIVGISSTSTVVPNAKNLGYFVSKLALNKLFGLLAKTDPGNDYKIILLGPVHTNLNRNLPIPPGVQGKIFEFLSLEAPEAAARCVKFISSRRRVQYPNARTFAFYTLLRFILRFAPGIYYKPLR